MTTLESLEHIHDNNKLATDPILRAFGDFNPPIVTTRTPGTTTDRASHLKRFSD